MAKVFKTVGRTKHPNWSGIATEIEKAMAGPVAKRLPEYAKDAVSDWDHKVAFPADVKRGADEIRVQSYPDGANADIWIWMVLGTGLYGPKHRKYPIRPKKAKSLAFPSAYAPHTTPAGGIHGPGTSSGPTVFADEVMHPGIQKRPLVTNWAEQVSTWFYDVMRDAVRQGVRRA